MHRRKRTQASGCKNIGHRRVSPHWEGGVVIGNWICFVDGILIANKIGKIPTPMHKYAEAWNMGSSLTLTRLRYLIVTISNQ